ncbi:MAG: trypsin-like peptidase domain-containing protein [Hyphomicrobiaceae bacterium]|nr:trypsin-like peptidase domain-containing protein [Hyphomicrobiaceae bacterium]
MSAAVQSVVTVLPEWPAEAARSEEPEASGVVWTGGRHIVTALHVVAKARAIRVRTADGLLIDARLAGQDPATDLAVLTIGTQLPAAEPSLRALDLGEKVCAIGNAFGLGPAVTCGVVSATGRAGVGFNPVEDFIQTDAAVNPGASGGALVDANGALVGLLSAIFTKKSDANIGVNFAVSMPLTARVATDLIAHGRVRRVETGLRLAPADPRVMTAGGSLLAPRVVGVATGSPGEKAGLVVGDEIVGLGSRRIVTPAEFTGACAAAALPARLELSVRRGGETVALILELALP